MSLLFRNPEAVATIRGHIVNMWDEGASTPTAAAASFTCVRYFVAAKLVRFL